MARIPDSEIERLKAEVSLERLAQARGIELVRRGGDLFGNCPFHDDREPSLVISPAKNLWHCMGECQVGGSVIDWVMRSEGVSFRHAIELLRSDSVPQSSGPPPKRTSTRHLQSPVQADADESELLGQVVDFYHEALKTSPDALAYLDRRRIAHPEALEHFRLGVSDRSLGYRLPERNRKEGGQLRARLIDLGLLRSSGHEHFSGSLVIPVTNPAGEVTEIYGRKLRNDLRPGTPKHLYLPGPHRGIWNEEALAQSTEIIICESLIDALTFWCAGFRHVTASYGTEGFGDDHIEAMRKYGTSRVLIAYDRDVPGCKAAQELAKTLMAEGIECFQILFPNNTDANDFTCGSQSPTEALSRVVRAAEWMGTGEHRTGEPKRLARAEPATPVPTTTEQPSATTHEQPAPTEQQSSSVPSLAAEPPLTAHAPPVQALPASPVPSPPPKLDHELVGDELRLVFAQRRWRIRGLSKTTSFDLLRVNVMVSCQDSDSVSMSTPSTSTRPASARCSQSRQRMNWAEEALVKAISAGCSAHANKLHKTSWPTVPSPRQKPSFSATPSAAAATTTCCGILA